MSLGFKYSLDYQYSLYCHYCSHQIKIGGCFSSPFRQDNNPSFNIFDNKKGKLIWKDFATGESGDIIDFIKKFSNISFKEAKELLDGHTNVPKQVIKEEEILSIHYEEKEADNEFLQYWSRYGISEETLHEHHVKNVEHIKIEKTNKIANIFSYEDYPIFKIYERDNKYKFYLPERKIKFLSNLNKDTIYNNNINNTNIILSKSIKDCLCFYELGYSSFCFQSESTIPNLFTLRNFIENNKLTTISIFYDNDDTGIKFSNKLLESLSGIENLKVNNFTSKINMEEKDISDFIFYNDLDKAKKLLTNLLLSHELHERQTN